MLARMWLYEEKIFGWKSVFTDLHCIHREYRLFVQFYHSWQFPSTRSFQKIVLLPTVLDSISNSSASAASFLVQNICGWNRTYLE